MLTGASLWLVYGLLEDDMNIIWANCVGLIFIIFMLVFKIKDKGQLS